MGRLAYMVATLKVAFANLSVVGAEIGVFWGEHAEIILKNLNIQKLYLIDPYISDDLDFTAHCKPLISGAKAIAERRLEAFADRITWLIMKSDDAVRQIQLPLDFVYIDGNHSYPYVLRDIENYMGLVKPGGWLGGHDYIMRRNPLIEVKKAVDEFIAKSGYRLNVSPGEYPDWWIQKLYQEVWV